MYDFFSVAYGERSFFWDTEIIFSIVTRVIMVGILVSDAEKS